MDLVYNPEVWQISYWEITFRMVLALLLGGLIGLERELGGHFAGFRTHILVCLGSAAIVILSIYGFSEFASEPNVRMDPARLAAQVISGIGFLGAGTIMRTGLTISGLTTAASLWVVAAIGLTVGAGFYFGAAILTLLVAVSLFFFNKMEKRFSRTKKTRHLIIRVSKGSTCLNQVVSHLSHNGIQINKLMMETEDSSGSEGILIIRLHLKLKKTNRYEQIIAELSLIDGMRGLETEGEAI
ncbi:putative Mg2+ transporter-C (MgtC) family protein [Paenibacillus phyllosphaerae]|uniref:Putative Mg2+ transporter-C (MgtC) family protein n=2 Tax=Paenibacillus phyllosphaerae TaxID=274593 RepID=A0A7W5B564_9BACL|nr:MgtC/SapB family protein [Paenibacillus phyllosphaerae]MBB3113856.1 putative Mg2+ transporter-C (MgtC) family protein [Paenibacillus phyllosphaerae]